MVKQPIGPFILVLLTSLFLQSCNTTPEKAVEPAAPLPPPRVVEAPPPPPPQDDVWSLLERGDYDKAKTFFEGEVGVNARDTLGRTPLHIAAEKQSPQMAAFFISLGAQLDSLDKKGDSPLGISTALGDGTTAHVIAAAGARIHQVQGDHSSPALRAIEKGGFLLRSILTPASMEERDDQGRSILHLAALQGKAAVIATILEAGDTTALTDKDGLTALDLAFTRTDEEKYAETAAALILAGSYSESGIFATFAPAVRSRNYDYRSADGVAPLHYSAEMGYLGYVDFLLNRGADINIKNASGTTPLHEATRYGHLLVMEDLLDRGADVNIQDAKGNSCLHLATPPDKQLEAVKLLLSHDANPNLRDEHGDSPLHIVIRLGRDPEVLRAMLENDADVGVHNSEGKTPLYLAVQERRDIYIPLLLIYGSDVFAADNEGITPIEIALQGNLPFLPAMITSETVLSSDSGGDTMLHMAIAGGSDVTVVGLILDKGALVNARNKEGNTALHLAVLLDSEESGALLLSRGADIFAPNAKRDTPLYLTFFPYDSSDKAPVEDVRDWMLTPLTLEARDGAGNTVLHYAAQWELNESIPMIVERGGQTEAANAVDETPIFMAVRSNAPETIHVLCAKGALVGARDSLGNTPLHAAVRWNAADAAEALIAEGADVNAHALNGRTPLHEAVKLGIFEVEKVLTANHADLEVRDNDGNTPFMDAIISGSPSTVERLASLGSDTMVRNDRGDTPLHLAVAEERSDLVNLLLGWGASIHAKNNAGRSPFQIALITSNRMVATLLTKDRIYTSDDEGRSPLHIALQSGANMEIIQSIVTQGARLTSVDANGRTALRLAIDLANWPAVKLLADAGSDPFSTAADGKSPAVIVLALGADKVRSVFSGPAIGARDSSGNTILHYAAQASGPELITLLLELGANQGSRNIARESPADVALRWNRPSIAEMLKV